MLEVSVYTTAKPGQFLGHHRILGHDMLTPKLAKMILGEMAATHGGMVYQDGVRLADGTCGTLGYRVYKGGRTKRMFWPWAQTEMDDFLQAR